MRSEEDDLTGREEEERTIGRYTIDRLLARGGMAEVFLARAEGPGGFAKQLVVKRILPEYAEDPVFEKMFLNEAQVAAKLNHPNIVQIFEFGEEHGRYYLAMEYIDGISLRQLTRFFMRRGQTMPPALAAKLMLASVKGCTSRTNTVMSRAPPCRSFTATSRRTICWSPPPGSPRWWTSALRKPSPARIEPLPACSRESMGTCPRSRFAG